MHVFPSVECCVRAILARVMAKQPYICRSNVLACKGRYSRRQRRAPMDHRTKGFTLVEVLITLAVFLILITMAVPMFTRSVQGTRADTEIGDLQRGLNYARLEAIDRGTCRELAGQPALQIMHERQLLEAKR